MAVLTNEELTNRLAERFGDTEDENDISFVEDITDTFNDLRTSANVTQLQDLQKKYAELQKKYRDRFFNSSGSDDSGVDDLVQPEHTDPEPKVLRFEDLFKEI